MMLCKLKGLLSSACWYAEFPEKENSSVAHGGTDETI